MRRICQQCLKDSLKRAAVNSRAMARSKQRSAALIDEASVCAPAIRDLAEIADYIHQRNPKAATRVRAVILGSLQDLVLFPELGRRQKLEGVRKLVVRHYPYLVYYSVDQPTDEIVILSIQHQARRRQYEDA